MISLEQAIASYEISAERYHKAFLHCKAHGGEFYQSEAESNKTCYEHDRQLAAWLRELKERREHGLMQGCYGCKHKPFEEKNRCRSCKRMCLDKYEPERRTDVQRTGD